MKRYFYQGNKLVSIDGEQPQRFFRRGILPLAQLQPIDAILLGVGLTGSVYSSEESKGRGSFSYNSYGVCRPHGEVDSGLRFNGELSNLIEGSYLLGNGVRVFSPALMRFISSDEFSPFGRGGINSYAYCNNNPVGKVDPSGRVATLAQLAMNAIPAQQRTRFKVNSDLGVVYKKLSKKYVKGMGRLQGLDTIDAVDKIKSLSGAMDPTAYDLTKKHYQDIDPALGAAFELASVERLSEYFAFAASSENLAPMVNKGLMTEQAAYVSIFNVRLAVDPVHAKRFAKKMHAGFEQMKYTSIFDTMGTLRSRDDRL